MDSVSRRLSLPKNWPQSVKTAVVHVIALAHVARRLTLHGDVPFSGGRDGGRVSQERPAPGLRGRSLLHPAGYDGSVGLAIDHRRMSPDARSDLTGEHRTTARSEVAPMSNVDRDHRGNGVIEPILSLAMSMHANPGVYAITVDP